MLMEGGADKRLRKWGDKREGTRRTGRISPPENRGERGNGGTEGTEGNGGTGERRERRGAEGNGRERGNGRKREEPK